MIWRLILLAAAAAATGAAFGGEDDDFNDARRHFARDNARLFAAAAQKIPADSAYRPLLEYWAAMLDLRRGRAEALENVRLHSASPFARGRAARALAEHYLRAGAREKFAVVAGISPCATLLARLHSRRAEAAEARRLWDAEQKFSDALCNAAYKQARRDGLLTEKDLWMKLRGLAGGGLLRDARRFLRHFPIMSYRAVRKTARRAERYIRGRHSLSAPADRALVMIAAIAAAKKNPELAARRWRSFAPYFSAEENNQAWAKIAERAARAHRKNAMELYELAPSFASGYDENARAWRVRAALRAGKYADVARTIENMPESESSLSAWRYWRAAALARLGDRAESAKQMRALAADADDYYGLLARETLDVPPPRGNKSADAGAKTADAKARGDFALALAARRAGDMDIARRIWAHAVRHSAPPDLRAASRAASRAGWHLASINAAEAAGGPAELRHPAPYQNTIDKYSARFGLDRAFVYALIRRESRFTPDAVSSAKARGLMQVLPSTALKVARRHGYGRYRTSRLTRVDTNVIIGATYLHDLARQFNAHPAHVAAAYNAGPGRAARWRKNIKDTLILVENIPLRETRLYVKALLAARVHYARRFGAPPPSIRHLLEASIFAAQKQSHAPSAQKPDENPPASLPRPI